jgi:hypothetical protein
VVLVCYHFSVCITISHCIGRSFPKTEAIHKGKRVLIASHENVIRGILSIFTF